MVRLWALYQKMYIHKFPKIIITTFNHVKAFKPTEEQIKQLNGVLAKNNQPISWISNWQEYIRLLKISKEPKNILLIGSFYFVSEFKSVTKNFST